MAFNFAEFCDEYFIEYYTEGKNVHFGWINIKCLFCDDHSNHLGFNLKKDYFTCWKCGWHSIEEVIAEIKGCDFFEARKIRREFSGVTPIIQPQEKAKAKSGILVWPKGTGALEAYHKKYLRNRGFDPDYLEEKYKLKATKFHGQYKYRIIIPVYFEGQPVSYVGRDWTGKQDIRYKACYPDKEIISIKDVLFNIDNCKEKYCFCVEGTFDVFRMGDDSLSTLGTTLTPKQFELLIDRFEMVFVIFDRDKEAQEKAVELCNELSTYGLRAINIRINSEDPAALIQEKALKLKIDLIRKYIKKELEGC